MDRDLRVSRTTSEGALLLLALLALLAFAIASCATRGARSDPAALMDRSARASDTGSEWVANEPSRPDVFYEVGAKVGAGASNQLPTSLPTTRKYSQRPRVRS